MECWDRLATTWARVAEDLEGCTRALDLRMVELLGVRAGDRVLEIGAGPSSTSLIAASRMGRSCLILSTDMSPAMVRLARSRSIAHRIGNISHIVMDATAMPLDSGSVDGILCRFALYAMSDPQKALEECGRVLLSGRRLVCALWGAAPPPLLARALEARGLLCSKRYGELDGWDWDELFSSVFEYVDVMGYTLSIRFDSFEDYWRVASSVSLDASLSLAQLQCSEQEEICNEVRLFARPYQHGQGYVFPAQAVLYVAWKE